MTWSRSPATSNSGARSGFAKSTTLAALDFGRRSAVDTSNSAAAGSRYRQFGMPFIGVGARNRIGEHVVKVGRADRYGFAAVARVTQPRPCRTPHRQRSPQHPARLRRRNGDSRASESAVEQQLGDQPAHRVADDDRSVGQGADECVEVLGRFGQSDSGICRPVRRVHDVARGPVPLDPGPPAIGRQPQSVDQHNRRREVRHRL